MTEREMLLRRRLPVYVNSFNMPTYLGRLVDNLRKSGFGNIIILDQASTTVETRRVLEGIDNHPECRVVYNKRNLGPRHFFESLNYLMAGRYFIYTDPDVELPPVLPDNFVSRMIDLTSDYRVGKVGCALDLSDSHLFDSITSFQGENGSAMSVVEYESRYWRIELEPQVFRALTDTTFALYNRRFYKFWRPHEGLRVAGPFTIKHRPWYIDKRMPEEELVAYKKACLFSSWFNDNSKNLFRRPVIVSLAVYCSTFKRRCKKVVSMLVQGASVTASPFERLPST